jgi:hypothetical protein
MACDIRHIGYWQHDKCHGIIDGTCSSQKNKQNQNIVR